jgi:hypothetical protein
MTIIVKAHPPPTAEALSFEYLGGQRHELG